MLKALAILFSSTLLSSFLGISTAYAQSADVNFIVGLGRVWVNPAVDGGDDKADVKIDIRLDRQEINSQIYHDHVYINNYLVRKYSSAYSPIYGSADRIIIKVFDVDREKPCRRVCKTRTYYRNYFEVGIWFYPGDCKAAIDFDNGRNPVEYSGRWSLQGGFCTVEIPVLETRNVRISNINLGAQWYGANPGRR